MRNAFSPDRPSSAPSEHPRRFERSKLAGIGTLAIVAGMNLEGCASTTQQGHGPGRNDWYNVNGITVIGEHEEASREAERRSAAFERNARQAETVSMQERRALGLRLNEMDELRIPEARDTYNEVGLERAWRTLADVDLDETGYTLNFPHYDAGDTGQGAWQAFGRGGWQTLVGELRNGRPGVYQLHVTESGYSSQLTSDERPPGIAGQQRIHATLRYSEGANLGNVLPESSPRLGLERHTEEAVGEGYARSEESARIRALASLVQNVSHVDQPAMVQVGTYLVDRHTINRVSISSRSSAYYLQNVRFETEETHDPLTGQIGVHATVEATVVTNVIPFDHRLNATNGRIERPLFPMRQE